MQLSKHFSLKEMTKSMTAQLIDFSIEMKEHVDKNKLYISYFCNEQGITQI